MYWGAKARFHDVDKVVKELNPKLVEFHLTDEDVKTKYQNKKIYNVDYSIHLPEYWAQVLIDPCNTDKVLFNIKIYNECITAGLNMTEFYEFKGKMKVIIHPGGATVDKLIDKIDRFDLYKRYQFFVTALMTNSENKNNIELLVENMPPLPWFYGGQYFSNIFCDPYEIRAYCEENKTGFCFDISHMGLYCNHIGFDLIKAIKIVKPYIKQVHIADAEGTDGEGASIGAGNINFKSVMQELKDLDVAIIPEPMWGHKNNYAEFKKTINICSDYLRIR